MDILYLIIGLLAGAALVYFLLTRSQEANRRAWQQQVREAYQAKMDAEDAERKAAQKVIDDAAAAEQKKKDDERQAELDEQAEEQRQAQKVIDDENARIAQEAAAKEEAKALEEEEREAAERALRLAPDSDKLLIYADALTTVNVPKVESDEAKRTLLLALEKIKPVIEYIRNEARKMK